jgi:hypothetical protein
MFNSLGQVSQPAFVNFPIGTSVSQMDSDAFCFNGSKSNIRESGGFSVVPIQEEQSSLENGGGLSKIFKNDDVKHPHMFFSKFEASLYLNPNTPHTPNAHGGHSGPSKAGTR